jgi:hypothetical protein
LIYLLIWIERIYKPNEIPKKNFIMFISFININLFF